MCKKTYKNKMREVYYNISRQYPWRVTFGTVFLLLFAFSLFFKFPKMTKQYFIIQPYWFKYHLIIRSNNGSPTLEARPRSGKDGLRGKPFHLHWCCSLARIKSQRLEVLIISNTLKCIILSLFCIQQIEERTSKVTVSIRIFQGLI
jgi:hypothetical protein